LIFDFVDADKRAFLSEARQFNLTDLTEKE